MRMWPWRWPMQRLEIGHGDAVALNGACGGRLYSGKSQKAAALCYGARSILTIWRGQ